MKNRWLMCLALALLTHSGPADAATQTWFGFQIGVTGGTPPPPVRWQREPETVVVNQVRIVEDERCDDDVFCCDNSWWRMSGGWWYRSANWRGPWVAVDVRRVPRAVFVVPERHWKHHPHGMPPGQWKRERREREHEFDRYAEREHKHEREHGRDHDRD